MKNKKILFIICGGIATYKVCSLVSFYSKENTTKIIMTEHATQFVTPLTFETLSKQKVLSDMFQENEYNIVPHIHYSQEYDFIIVAPATANIIGKVANGIADDLASSTLIAATKPIIFIPAMNEKMYLNPIVQKNIQTLKAYNYHVIEPQNGYLACGYTGIGKYPNNDDIIKQIETIINKGEK